MHYATHKKVSIIQALKMWKSIQSKMRKCTSSRSVSLKIYDPINDSHAIW